MLVTGKTTDRFLTPVCNIFRQTILDGELCYQADVNELRERVDRNKIASEGFVFLLDYNSDRMASVQQGDEKTVDEVPMFEKDHGNRDQAMIYIETLGNYDYLVAKMFHIYLTLFIIEITKSHSCHQRAPKTVR